MSVIIWYHIDVKALDTRTSNFSSDRVEVIGTCYGLMLVSPQNYVEILTPNVMVLGEWHLWEMIRSRGRALKMGLVPS